MRFSRPIAVLAFCAFLVACQSPRQSFVQGSAPGSVAQVYSGVQFPERIGFFQIAQLAQYDHKGRDVSVGYQAGVLIAGTVYVYPRKGKSVQEEVAFRAAEIRRLHPGSKQISTGYVRVTPKNIKAERAKFLFPPKAQEEWLESDLIVAQRGPFFVKYRFTYPLSHSTRAHAEVEQFCRTWDWTVGKPR